ncbi:MAG: DUF485 domain-containing protein [Burkholderiaceae bacterium]|jgi:uncharacterized membrane protein (DUF485 family)|nr:DUF485 domain-containing protein [Burkholderiaceae bacterium]
MESDIAQRVASHPRYRELVSKRTAFGWWLALAGMIAYYGFILLVAFNKPLLASKLGSGVTTVGMPLGVAVIVFTIIITWIYVRRANTEFDALTEQIVKGALK